MIGPAPICLDCVHFFEDEYGFKCKAFPEGIPDEILDGEHDHHKLFKGDHGIQFKKKEDIKKKK